MTRELTGQPRTWPNSRSLLPSPVRASPPLQIWLLPSLCPKHSLVLSVELRSTPWACVHHGRALCARCVLEDTRRKVVKVPLPPGPWCRA